MNELMQELRLIRDDIHQLRGEVTRYKGFVGGVMWSVGALSTALGLTIAWIKEHVL